MRDQLLAVLNNYKAYRKFNMTDVIEAERYLDIHFPNWESDWQCWINCPKFKAHMLNQAVDF